MSIVKIGGGQGFWGDSPDAAIHMAKTADLRLSGRAYHVHPCPTENEES